MVATGSKDPHIPWEIMFYLVALSALYSPKGEKERAKIWQRVSIRGWLFLPLGVSSCLLPMQGISRTLPIALPWSKYLIPWDPAFIWDTGCKNKSRINEL